MCFPGFSKKHLKTMVFHPTDIHLGPQQAVTFICCSRRLLVAVTDVGVMVKFMQ